ncbi:MAG: TonB family protein [Candidatus Omnitrophica bacterium]|nr:TonB family protein [Candidatus Omnitrophota bacterium]
MQNRIDWVGYTGRVKKGSFLISIFLHFSLLTLIFIPIKEKKIEREIFIVKLIEMPNIEKPKVLESTIEKVEIPKINKKQSLKKEKLKIKDEAKFEKISETGHFSVEDYKKKIYSKIETGVKESPSSSKTDIKVPEIKSLKISPDESSASFNTVSSSIPEWYINLIKNKIQNNWALKDFLIGLSAIVSFRIYKDGKVESIIIEKSSGNRNFDSSIIDAIKSVKKWPEFPNEIKDKYLDIVIEFKTEG